MEKLENKFHDEFAQSAPTAWLTLDSGRQAGLVRSAGGDGFTAGNLTFVRVFEAGYASLLFSILMRPEASL